MINRHPLAGLPRSEREKAVKEEPAEEVWGGVSDDLTGVFGGAVREEVPRESVRAPESNSSTFTLDGVDMMGERLANEVFSVVKNEGWVKEDLICGSFVRGLVARYCRKLYEQQLVIKVV
ncbi:hypothetical protein Bca52824_015611 [Brassica carinata]|uniref:DUF676 domain-containing protein n=1 Tax=Brassica carinata TaxID=52824 RepID=A0A8X7W227_BRACI|nr:hypothetical protein Bca52824_015611 [Brassica carinata]